MWKWFTWRRVLLILMVVFLLGVAGFVVWANTVPNLMPEAVAALVDDAAVDVTQAGWSEFAPVGVTPTVGYVLYPGGKVPAGAYAPLANALAAQGYFVAIVNAPLYLALFDTNAAAAVLSAHPQITRWAVGGHSLGGVAASSFAQSNPLTVQGLVLMGSIPFPNANLQTRTDLIVTSIYGTLDGLQTVVGVEASAAELPSDTMFVAIEGGNHAQFGYYGAQAGDNVATISYAEQTEQVVTATVALLSRIGG